MVVVWTQEYSLLKDCGCYKADIVVLVNIYFRWTIFFSIVEWRMLSGILFLVGLGCVGLCLVRLGSYLPASGRVVARGVWWIGR